MTPPLPDKGSAAPQSTSQREIVSGSCVCGHASLALDVTPSAGYLTLSAYCHCTRCQRTHSAPFTWTTHWKQEAVIWTCPASNLSTYEMVSGLKYKIRCAGACGVQVGSWSESKREWSIWPEILQRNAVGHILGADRFKPTAHQFYGEWRICEMGDSLPRYIGYEGHSDRVV